MTGSEKERLAQLEARLEIMEDGLKEIKAFNNEMRTRWEEQERASTAGFNIVNNHLSELKRKVELGTNIVKWCLGIVGSVAATGIGAWITSLLTK